MSNKTITMRTILAFILLQITCTSNAQIYSFFKSSEFEQIKAQVSKVPFGNINDPWVGGFLEEIHKNDQVKAQKNHHFYSDEDIERVICLDENYVIFSYHLSVGSNTGTLLFNRASKKISTYPFYALELNGRVLSVMREGYKNGHWWEKGTLNLVTNVIHWSKKIER